MLRNYSLFTCILIAVFFWACESPQKAEEQEEKISLPVADTDNGGIQLGDGFGAMVVADELGNAGHLVVDDEGDIYVKIRRVKKGEGNGSIIAMRDADGDGKMDEKVGFGDYSGTGIDIQGNYLYASSDVEVFRYKLAPGQLMPDTASKESLISGFLDQGQHASKTFTFDKNNNIYVNIGAPSNACQEKMRQVGSPGLDPCPQLEWQAGIWRFNAQEPGQNLKEHGYKYATGIRNAMALDWNMQSDGLFALQHGRDDLHRLAEKYYSTKDNEVLPAEEFLQIDKDDDFGWPYCHFDQFKGEKMLNPEYGGDREQQGRCAEAKKPIFGFPGHLAPNDLLFYQGDQFPAKYKNGAFIAFHGSWNRAPEPQAGYFVVFVPMNEGKITGEWEVFAEGFPQVDTVKSTRDAVYRPVGLAEGPDGSLYISDSRKGRIWRIMYYGLKEV